MDLLDWRYAGHQKDIIQLSADLDRGWGHLEKKGRKPDYWVSIGKSTCQAKVNQNSGAICTLSPLDQLHGISPHLSGTVCRCELGYNSVSVNGSRMVVDIPLLNAWSLLTNQGEKEFLRMSHCFRLRLQMDHKVSSSIVVCESRSKTYAREARI